MSEKIQLMQFKENIVPENLTIKEALVRLNELSLKDRLTLFVINSENQLTGTLTDGDIRRALIKNTNIESQIREVMNPRYKFLKKAGYTLEEIDHFKKDEIVLIPVLDDMRRIIKILDLSKYTTMLPVDAVIMAGGEGKRLKPLTDHVPKPLLKVGEKPILEHNIDRLASFGIDNVYISVNYLSSKIKEYFGNGSSKNISISYAEESIPSGTIGSVGLISNFSHDEVLVMNSDLLTNIDFEDLYRFFKKNNSDMAVACIPYQVSLPYGIIENDGVKIVAIKEKPTYTYYSNAGIYILKKEMLKYIPKNSMFNATDLMETLIKGGHKVVNYPILSYWLDIGKHDDYIKAQEDIKHLKL